MGVSRVLFSATDFRVLCRYRYLFS